MLFLLEDAFGLGMCGDDWPCQGMPVSPADCSMAEVADVVDSVSDFNLRILWVDDDKVRLRILWVNTMCCNAPRHCIIVLLITQYCTCVDSPVYDNRFQIHAGCVGM